MGWIKVTDDFYDNEKLCEVGPLGIALHFAAMGFCNRNLTDGFFKKGKARLLLDFDGIAITTATGECFTAGVDGDDAAKLVIGWMVAAGLWHEKGHDCDECHAREDGGEPGAREYLIHDYLEYQPARAEVEAKAEANRKRVEAFREARKLEKAAANGSGNAGSNAERNALRTANVQHTPNPTPNPSTSLLVTSGGGVAEVDAREPRAPRPHCARHEENHDGPCRKCQARRKWDEANVERVQADELDRKRTAKAEAGRVTRECPRCDDDGWLLGADGTPTDPARKCTHRSEAQHA